MQYLSHRHLIFASIIETFSCRESTRHSNGESYNIQKCLSEWTMILFHVFWRKVRDLTFYLFLSFKKNWTFRPKGRVTYGLFTWMSTIYTFIIFFIIIFFQRTLVRCVFFRCTVSTAWRMRTFWWIMSNAMTLATFLHIKSILHPIGRKT